MNRSKAVKEVVTTVVKSARPAKVGRRRSRRARTSPTSSLVKSYIDSLNNPFDISPPSLGFGTFSRTTPFVAYVHGTTRANLDGTLSLAMFGDIGRLIGINNNGVASSVWSYLTASNYNSITSFGGSYRIVSGGIRACPVISSTSNPGLVYATALEGRSLNTTVANATSTTISQYPSVHLGLGVYGATVLTRPSTERAGDFTGTSAWDGSSIQPFSIPILTFQNLPPVDASNGCLVAFEAILNCEILPSGDAAALLNLNSTGNVSVSPTLANQFASYTQLLTAVMPRLDDPVHLDFNEGGPSSASRSSRASMGKAALRPRSMTIMTDFGQTYAHRQEQTSVRATPGFGDTIRRSASPDPPTRDSTTTTTQTVYDAAVDLARSTGIYSIGAITGVAANEINRHLNRHPGNI